MSSESPQPPRNLKPIRVPFREHLRDLRMYVLPGVTWLAACALVAMLWLREPQAAPLSGIASGELVLVSAPESARVDEVFVDLFEDVRAGQLLVSLGSQSLDGELEIARLDLRRISAEREAERASIEFEVAHSIAEREDSRAADGVGTLTDQLRRIRQFRGDEQDTEIKALEAIVDRVDAELEVERLNIQLARAQSLAEGNIGAQADADDLLAQITQASAAVNTIRAVEERLGVVAEEARERRVDYEALDPTLPPLTVLDPRVAERLAGHEASLAVQRTRIIELESRVAGLTVRAPSAGRIASLPIAVGQIMLPAQEMLRIDATEAEAILMYLPENAPLDPQPGDTVLVRRGRSESEATVLAVAAAAEQMPVRLWLDPRLPQYGRAYRLSLPVDMPLRPGDRVGLVPLRP
jgi:multidrug resistance efflux pump